jgi:hypothetical protein
MCEGECCRECEVEYRRKGEIECGRERECDVNRKDAGLSADGRKLAAFAIQKDSRPALNVLLPLLFEFIRSCHHFWLPDLDIIEKRMLFLSNSVAMNLGKWAGLSTVTLRVFPSGSIFHDIDWSSFAPEQPNCTSDIS